MKKNLIPDFLLFLRNSPTPFHATQNLKSMLESAGFEQILEKDVLDKILEVIGNKINEPLIVICRKNWHEGVIGIVASRIKDKFNKPVIIISLNKNGIGKASARSIVGFDIGSVIRRSSHICCVCINS